MRIILFCFLICGLSINAQNYSIKRINSFTNGNPGPMKGIPGDLFYSTITFSNSSASAIKIFIDRYKNDKPMYWGICYCYIQCHNIAQDTLTIDIDPFSTADVSIQFKTDSVNPGIANDSFTIYQLGFQSNSQNLNMTASTLNDVGIKEYNNSNVNLYLFPNPTSGYLTVGTNGEKINEIKIIDALGCIKSEFKSVNNSTYQMDVSRYTSGIYFVQIKSGNNWYTKNFVVN